MNVNKRTTLTLDQDEIELAILNWISERHPAEYEQITSDGDPTVEVLESNDNGGSGEMLVFDISIRLTSSTEGEKT